MTQKITESDPEFIVSFIPRYVSNPVLLMAYRVLSIFGVPGFIRERHYRENRIRLEGPHRSFCNEGDFYIENQSQWGNIRFGVGRRCSMAYAGCEIIAVYNAWKALGGPASGEYMAELIRTFEARGAALMGTFGTAPTAIADYFRKNGFCVETTDGTNEEEVDRIGRRYAVLTATAYNNKNDITGQIHTVCITRNRDGKYVLHNAYLRDEKGRYRESVLYKTLQEAVAHISGREPRLIYLIGIGGQDVGGSKGTYEKP